MRISADMSEAAVMGSRCGESSATIAGCENANDQTGTSTTSEPTRHRSAPIAFAIAPTYTLVEDSR
jgi:hypothetical protein